MMRQPIVTICGHVDHGKTSLADAIRGTKVAEKEAGKITQKISFTSFPAENIKKGCFLLDKYNIPVKIPGFLLVDTPGHQAFTNLRKRGGSLADLAIVVISIIDGVMPQTAEVLSILKQNKTPFIVCMNKIDSLSGWRKQDEDIKLNIEKQSIHTQQEFQEKMYKITSALESHGFKSELFFNLKDFTQKICLVPISAKTKEGLAELLMVLCGISQKFLSKQLSLGEKARGVIFELKKEKSMSYIEAILYDGKLKQGDEIAIATFGNPIIAKIRALEEICPLCDKFENKKEVIAATGIRMQLSEAEKILPGMPFQILKGNIQEIEKEFKKELNEIETDSEGIIIKAESLGSLEALLFLLKQANIKVLKAEIGNIKKSDISAAKANANLLDKCILGFNVVVDEDAKPMQGQIKIFIDDVVYKLIENLTKWGEEKRKEIEKEKLLGLTSIFKLEILHKFVFRNSKPAIFGVKVLAGKLKQNIETITENNEEIARIKAIQHENKAIREAEKGMEIAISLPGTTFDRQLKNARFLYSQLTEKQFKNFKENKELLTGEEVSVLKEIADIKRKEKATWGV